MHKICVHLNRYNCSGRALAAHREIRDRVLRFTEAAYPRICACQSDGTAPAGPGTG
jgi:hypothetical protein